MAPSPPPHPHSTLSISPIIITTIVLLLAPKLIATAPAHLEETAHHDEPTLALGVKPPPPPVLGWPIIPNVGPEDDHGFFDDEDEDEEKVVMGEDKRMRSLLWWRKRFRYYYYISYRALAAGKVPCPSRSGRSYYTHDCYTTKAPVNPYTRGCSAITRCRR